MNHTVRRAAVLGLATAALLGLGAGLALADDYGSDSDNGSDSGSARHETQPGGGSGLDGGAPFQVVRGAPALPAPDPTFGEGTALPPVYNGYSAATGS